MGAGRWTLTVLWLLLGQSNDEVLHHKERALRIPINFEDARRSTWFAQVARHSDV